MCISEPSNRGGREDGGRRKGGRNNREDASGQTKPSQNVSLFSFLEEKLPLDAAESGKQKQTSTNPKPSETSKPFYEQQQQRHAQGRRGGGSEKPDRNSAAEKSDRNRDSLGQGGDRRRRGGGRGGHQDGQAPRENGQTEIEDANSQFRRKGDRAEYRSVMWAISLTIYKSKLRFESCNIIEFLASYTLESEITIIKCFTRLDAYFLKP